MNNRIFNCCFEVVWCFNILFSYSEQTILGCEKQGVAKYYRDVAFMTFS
jgi:hypothetical protein